MKKACLAIVLVVVLLAGCTDGNEQTYETIDIDHLQQLQDDGKIVLDVREMDEFAEGHIIDAVNLPLSKLKEGNFTGLDTDQTYIVICRSGNRSIEASDILFKEGFNVVNVSQGMSSWTGNIE